MATTDNTHHSEPQLKEWLVFILHPKPQFKGYHFEPQLKECYVFTLHLDSELKGCHSEPQL